MVHLKSLPRLLALGILFYATHVSAGWGDLKRLVAPWCWNLELSQLPKKEERDAKIGKGRNSNSLNDRHHLRPRHNQLQEPLSRENLGSGGALVVQGTRDVSMPAVIVWGALLAMNSGYINGLCLSGMLSKTKQAASAVTGAWTNSAIGFAKDDFELYTFHTKCVLSYMLGSFLSGLLYPTTTTSSTSASATASATTNRVQVPMPTNPSYITIIIPSVQSLFFIASVLMYFASQTSKTSKLVSSDTCLFLSLICNGIQNSLTSTTTANLIRSSHFSGISSDIGTFIGQYLRGNKANIMKLKIFWILVCSFWLGGVISVGILQSLVERKEYSFLVSSGLYAGLGLLAGYKSIRNDSTSNSSIDVSKNDGNRNSRGGVVNNHRHQHIRRGRNLTNR